jgi:hypothetical protein
MPRPNLPIPKDVIEIVKGMKAEGIASGAIRCPDGTEITWGGIVPVSELSELEKWKANRNAAS